MTTQLFLLSVCFFGALVQTTTGFGFGMIVAPLLLTVYAPVDAIQITGALTLAIVLIITPFVVKNIRGGELGKLAVGSVIGLIAGSVCLKLVPINGIRIAALLMLAYSFIGFVRSHWMDRAALPASEGRQRRNPSGLGHGVASGVMGATLAMPGPMVLFFLRERRFSPAQVRATVFALMIASYAAMLAVSIGISGVSDLALSGLLTYLPPTLAGLVVGSLLTRHLPTILLDIITTLLMFSTLAVLGAKILGMNV